MKYSFAKLSDAGPRQGNEDAVGAWPIVGGGVAVAVADGLGGMGGGERASSIAVEHFRKFADSAATPEMLSALAMDIHLEIRNAQLQSATLSSMATTLSAAIVNNGRLVGVHCGDSRISIARGLGIKRLTQDQTEGQRLFDAGKISKRDLLDYPRKNILDSALGIHGTPIIQTVEFDVVAGDKIFFTTDGLHNVIPLRELWSLASKADDAQQLISIAKDLMATRPKEDNYSLVALYLKE